MRAWVWKWQKQGNTMHHRMQRKKEGTQMLKVASTQHSQQAALEHLIRKDDSIRSALHIAFRRTAAWQGAFWCHVLADFPVGFQGVWRLEVTSAAGILHKSSSNSRLGYRSAAAKRDGAWCRKLPLGIDCGPTARIRNLPRPEFAD